MEEEEAQPGRKSWGAGGKKGRTEKKEEVCESGPVEDKMQCLLRGGKNSIYWLLSATLFHYKQACKKSKTEV